MNDFEIVFYQRANGECPVGDFLDSLNKVMRFKMMNKLDMLELYGNHPRGDYFLASCADPDGHYAHYVLLR